MHAMQYEITLPADYDMAIIHDRVATRGAALDDFPGLGLKAYCVRERGVDGSPVNQYAPFYLWNEVSGMNRFLVGGGGFRGIVDSFGRPVVRHWVGVGVHPGPARATSPRTATRLTTAIPAETDPADAVALALAELRERGGAEGVHTTALAVDPHRWELVHFTLWANVAPALAGVHYRVAHLCLPELAALPTGRHW